MAKGPIDDELRPSFGKSRGSSGSATAKLGTRLARRPQVRLGKPSGKARTAAVREGSQRAVVKVRYRLHGVGAASLTRAKPGNLGEHLRYIQRESAMLDEGRPDLFGPDPEQNVERAAIVSGFGPDRHHYRLIISPENAHKLESLEDTTRRVMAQLGEELGRDLEWAAAVHNNTDQPHVHVVLRGASDGKQLTLNRKTVSYGIRRMVEDEITRELGPRTRDQVRESYQRQVVTTGVTELDRTLNRALNDGLVNLRTCACTDEMRPHLAGRLQHLQRMGLAEPRGGHVHRIAPDFVGVLRDAARQQEIGAILHKHVGAEASRVARYAKEGPEVSSEGRVLARGYVTGGQRAYLIVDTGSRKLYAEVPADYAPEVVVGGIARVYDRGRAAVDPQIQNLVKGADVTGAAIDAHPQDALRIRKRLDQLARAGDARPKADGYELASTVLSRMQAGKPLRGSAPAIKVIDAEHPESKVTANRWTSLDRHLARGEAPEWKGGKALLEQRVEFLVERGLARREGSGRARFVKGATARLRDVELDHATAAAAKELGLRPSRIPSSSKVQATVLGVQTLAQGRAVVLKHEGGVAVEVAAGRSAPAGSSVAVSRDPSAPGVRLTQTAQEEEREA